MLNFLARHNKLENKHIDMLWEHLRTRHEGVTQIVYDGSLSLVRCSFLSSSSLCCLPVFTCCCLLP